MQKCTSSSVRFYFLNSHNEKGNLIYISTDYDRAVEQLETKLSYGNN